MYRSPCLNTYIHPKITVMMQVENKGKKIIQFKVYHSKMVSIAKIIQSQ